MKSLDDIKGFKKKTGLSNYKVLSEYNVENLLTPWAIIEKLKNESEFHSSIISTVGLSDFSDVTAKSTIKEKADTTKTKIYSTPSPTEKVSISAGEHTDKGIPSQFDESPRFISENTALQPVISSQYIIPEFGGDKKQRFEALFNSRAKKISNHTVRADEQRELSLKTLFDRIASCQ